MKHGAHGDLEGQPPRKRAKIEVDNLDLIEDDIVVEDTEQTSINDLPPDLLMEVQRWLPASNFRGADKVQSIAHAWQSLENTDVIRQKRTRATQFHEQFDKVSNIQAEINRLQQQLRIEKDKLEPIEREFRNHCKLLTENKQFILDKMKQFGEANDWNIEDRFQMNGVNYVGSRLIKNNDLGVALFCDAKVIDPAAQYVKSRQGGNRVFINKDPLVKALLNPNQANLQKLATTMQKIRSEQDESNLKLKGRI